MKPIRVYVRGGVVQDIENIPKGITIEVIDYDTDGADEGRTTKLENGDECFLAIYEGE